MPGNKRVSDEDFIKAWKALGSPIEVSKSVGLTIRSVYQRRTHLESKGILLPTISNKAKVAVSIKSFERRRTMEIRDGVVIAFSDAHFWPGDQSLANHALIEVCRMLNPQGVIANGDLLDGSLISRHEPRGWQYAPTVKEEVDICSERLSEIYRVTPKAWHLRTLGNHDIRFERHLAIHAPQYKGVVGTSLEDHIPDWPCSWSVEVNNVIVKHRWSGGVHATYNNTLKSGRSIVTGHLHSLNVRPYTDYDGTRFGVDTGTLADPDHDAFDYTEDNPKDWRSGFMVLTFRNGNLLWPEACYIDDGVAYFRGEPVA